MYSDKQKKIPFPGPSQEIRPKGRNLANEDQGIRMLEENEISLVRWAAGNGISRFQVGVYGLFENVVPQMAMFHHFKTDSDK